MYFKSKKKLLLTVKICKKRMRIKKNKTKKKYNVFLRIKILIKLMNNKREKKELLKPEDLKIIKGSKEGQYHSILPQVSSLLEGEYDQIANMANVCAALKEQFNFFWVGFYMVKGDELVLGPFQGPVACTRIKLGKGVCGSAWEQKKTIIVPDVDLFPGHIACSSASKSEIVIPIIRSGNVIGVLDVDSAELNSFDETDADYLLQIIELIEFHY
jgi:GAF domain-containing protein